MWEGTVGDIKGVGGRRNNVTIYFNEKIVKIKNMD